MCCNARVDVRHPRQTVQEITAAALPGACGAPAVSSTQRQAGPLGICVTALLHHCDCLCLTSLSLSGHRENLIIVLGSCTTANRLLQKANQGEGSTWKPPCPQAEDIGSSTLPGDLPHLQDPAVEPSTNGFSIVRDITRRRRHSPSPTATAAHRSSEPASDQSTTPITAPSPAPAATTATVIRILVAPPQVTHRGPARPRHISILHCPRACWTRASGAQSGARSGRRAPHPAGRHAAPAWPGAPLLT